MELIFFTNTHIIGKYFHPYAGLLVFKRRKHHTFRMWDFKFKSFMQDLKNYRERPPVVRKNCDVPGCDHQGEYRAPKSRHDLKDYYWFCLEHVRDYNQNWDYFKGMSQTEVEQHLYKTTVWDRPTWRMTEAGLNEERARQKIYEHFTSDGVFGAFSTKGEAPEEEAHINVNSIPHPAVDALAVLDLAPPIDWEQVKTRYKALAKQYHPDTNRNDKQAEERFKKISLAYTILKLSYQNFTKLDEK